MSAEPAPVKFLFWKNAKMADGSWFQLEVNLIELNLPVFLSKPWLESPLLLSIIKMEIRRIPECGLELFCSRVEAGPANEVSPELF